MNFDYSDLSVEDLEELSIIILDLIEMKKKLRFSDEYLLKLQDLLNQFENTLVLEFGAKNINISSDRRNISIDFDIDRKIFIDIREKLGKWYLNKAIVISKTKFFNLEFTYRHFGLIVSKNGIHQTTLKNKVYSDLTDLEKGLKDLVRELIKY